MFTQQTGISGHPTAAPAVMVHSLAQARMALAPGRPVTLLSAPGAGWFAGWQWWCGIIAAAGADAHILDCGEAPGAAAAALRAGVPALVLAPCPAFDALATLAAGLGAVLLPHAPPALDLAEPGAARRLAPWLA